MTLIIWLLSRSFPTSFVVVAALCFLSSTDFVGGIREAVQGWIFELLGVADNPGALVRAVIQKVPHLTLFGLLGFVPACEPSGPMRRWLFAASIAVAIGAEALQAATETRGFTLMDVTINVTSVVTAFLVTRAILSRRQQTSAPLAAAD